MLTNKNSIHFDYTKDDANLFTDDQKRYWRSIETNYIKLKSQCLDSIDIPISATHKVWISARVRSHASTSVMRLLYLVESFCDTSKNFNAVSAAIHIKAMVEIPLHLGYLVWILSEHNDFQSIKTELGKIGFGQRDKKTKLTFMSNISQKVFYTRADYMIKKLFKDQPSSINIFETLYKEANATGHHNYEGRNLLIGLTDKNGTWHVKDRKELFVFYTNNIFQLFLNCEAILSMSDLFLKAIDHYLEQLPDYFPEEIGNGRSLFRKIINALKNFIIKKKHE